MGGSARLAAALDGLRRLPGLLLGVGCLPALPRREAHPSRTSFRCRVRARDSGRRKRCFDALGSGVERAVEGRTGSWVREYGAQKRSSWRALCERHGKESPLGECSR